MWICKVNLFAYMKVYSIVQMVVLVLLPGPHTERSTPYLQISVALENCTPPTRSVTPDPSIM